MPPRYGQYGNQPVPVEQYQQQQPIMQVQGGPLPEQGVTFLPPQPQPGSDTGKHTALFALVVAALGAVGWWAYKSMEKDRKFRVGPKKMEDYEARDDDGDSDADRDSESDSALDDYEDADVDEEVRSPPHEEGGIKLVRG